jgi:hypothetical protein
VKTKFPKLSKTDLCEPRLDKIGMGNGSMSIAHGIAMVVVIVLSAYAGASATDTNYARCCWRASWDGSNFDVCFGLESRHGADIAARLKMRQYGSRTRYSIASSARAALRKSYTFTEGVRGLATF